MGEHDIGKFYSEKVAEYYEKYGFDYAKNVADAIFIALTLQIAKEKAEPIERLRKLCGAYEEWRREFYG